MQTGTALLSAALALFLLEAAPPALAQPVEQAQHAILQNQVNLLEARVPPRGTTEIILKEIADLKKDNVRLQTNLNETNARVLDLQNRVRTLEAKVFESPTPPPPGRNPAPTPPPAAQPSTLRAPFVVQDAAGRVLFRVDAGGAAGAARAVVGNPEAGRVEMGPGAGGSSSVQLFDASGALLSSLVANPSGSFLRVKDNEQSAMLGHRAEDGLGLYLRKGTAEFITLTATKSGEGTVKVFGPGAKAVAGLMADPDGGRMVLTGAAGGNSVVSVSSTPAGGVVRVFGPKGGKARAELASDGNAGMVNVFDAEGTAQVTLATGAESGAGRLVISNGKGSVVVQAGSDQSGRGLVKTGPFEGGVAGTMGGGLSAASSLVGNLSGKKQ